MEVKLLLLPVGSENLVAMQALPAAWAPVLQRGQQSMVEDMLLKVSPFLDAS